MQRITLTDVRRVLVAAALGASLLLTACSDGSEPTDPEPTPTESNSATTPEPSPSATESTVTPAVGGLACDAIDIAALTAATGLGLEPPSSAGKPGKREGCSIALREPHEMSFVFVDLLPRHGTLEKDVQTVMVLLTEKPERVTVAGRPGLMVSLNSQNLINVGVVTHVGDRLLQVRINSPEFGKELVEQLKSLTLAVAEQVAPAAG